MEKISCEIPDANPVDQDIKKILNETRVIAVVGLSDNPERDSFKVAHYLKSHGYRIVPVNPQKIEILDEKCYPNLKSIPFKVDVIEVFRNVDAIPSVIEDALSVSPQSPVIWMQLGIVNNEAAKKARDKGFLVVQSKCMKMEHQKLKK